MSLVRAAFTLIEFLVSAVALAVLAGLFLPGVQKVREAADRARCQNNLKHIAVAFQSYHDTNGRFPPGGSNTPPASEACSGPGCREAEWSWAFHLLPYIDQTGVYAADADTVRTTPIPTYHCPSRRPLQLYGGRATTGYAANAGSHPDGRDGVVMQTTLGRIRLDEITDGLANTVLVGEKRLNLAGFGVSKDDNEGYATPGWDDFEVYRIGYPPPAPDPTLPGMKQPFSMFGSSHPGVFNAVFVDGSVRTLRYTVNASAWGRACIRNDTEPDDPDNL